MLDINLIRKSPHKLDQALKRRGLEGLSVKILALDEQRRARLSEAQGHQENRNSLSKAIGEALAAGEKLKADKLRAEVGTLKQNIHNLKLEIDQLEKSLAKVLGQIPNMVSHDVPDGHDESANIETKRVGVQPNFDFTPKQHFELGEELGLMDFEVAAKLSGSRFVVLRGALARLERALGQYMLDIHTTSNGYSEISPPLLVREQAMFGTGQLPKFHDDQFSTTNGLWLIPTAEVSLTNLVRESTIGHAQLPIRVTALTQCFRREAGAAGRDTRGMIRLHQFAKVELVSITTEDQGEEELYRMVNCAEMILTRLGLAYRLVLLSAGDMGFSAAKTYDLEVWLPGQNSYREISSCSLCTDFQARRMAARYRSSSDESSKFVHTLNGSGVAVGRALVAVMENYQQQDGSITIPEVLQPYMGGLKRISRDECKPTSPLK